MNVRRLLIAVAMLSVSAVGSGCGAVQEVGDSASLAPADARVLAQLDGDLDSAQWRAARELIDRFPDGDRLLDELDEVRGVAGDQIVLVALDEEEAVALTQPRDERKLRSLVSEYHLVSRQINGWTAVAHEGGVLDDYERELDEGTLDGDERYEAARSELPDEALATVYVGGDSAKEWTAAALTAEGDGFRLVGRFKPAASHDLEGIDLGALAQVPGDALAVLAFGAGGFPTELPSPLGIDLAPFTDLFSGGAVIWVRSGAPIPEVTAILPDAEAADLDRLVRGFTGATPEQAQLDGSPAKRIRIGPMAITYADIGGRLALTTGETLRGRGHVGQIPGVVEGRERVGIEAKGLVYIDVGRVSSLLGFLGGFGGIPVELTRNLEHVDWLYGAYGGDGEEQEIGVFLAIE